MQIDIQTDDKNNESILCAMIREFSAKSNNFNLHSINAEMYGGDRLLSFSGFCRNDIQLLELIAGMFAEDGRYNLSLKKFNLEESSNNKFNYHVQYYIRENLSEQNINKILTYFDIAIKNFKVIDNKNSVYNISCNVFGKGCCSAYWERIISFKAATTMQACQKIKELYDKGVEIQKEFIFNKPWNSNG